jgi:hypothetical protein
MRDLDEGIKAAWGVSPEPGAVEIGTGVGAGEGLAQDVGALINKLIQLFQKLYKATTLEFFKGSVDCWIAFALSMGDGAPTALGQGHDCAATGL